MAVSIIVALLVALLSGMGVGGGGLFAVYLSVFTDVPQLSVQGYNLLFFLFSAGASVTIQLFRRHVPFFAVGVMILSGIVGALCGVALTSFFSAGWLRRLFGIMLVSGGIFSLKRTSSVKYATKVSTESDAGDEKTAEGDKNSEEK